MKTCSKCKIKKGSSEFNVRRASKDGFQPLCKECDKKAAERWKENNIDRAAKTTSTWKKENPKRVAEYNARHRKNNPEKIIARNSANYAEKIGCLIKQPCEICGNIQVGKHHDDYAKPLEVKWLCTKCHSKQGVKV